MNKYYVRLNIKKLKFYLSLLIYLSMNNNLNLKSIYISSYLYFIIIFILFLNIIQYLYDFVIKITLKNKLYTLKLKNLICCNIFLYIFYIINFRFFLIILIVLEYL